MSGGGTNTTLRKALGSIKDTTTINLAKVNSDYKELDIAIVKATNHVERPAKEKHMRAQRLQLASVYKGEAEKVLIVKKAEADTTWELGNAPAFPSPATRSTILPSISSDSIAGIIGEVSNSPANHLINIW
ncbi:hypothetical protein Droror1_Dr00006364 [Drosera rotundifolia]